MTEQNSNSSSSAQKGVVTALVIATLVILAAILASTSFLAGQLGEMQISAQTAPPSAPPSRPDAPRGAQDEPAPTVDVSHLLDDVDPRLGPDDAPIQIIEFSDYECPFCGRFYSETMVQLKEQYGDQIQWIWKDFPLPFHQQAPRAHAAAHCAGDQGNYWEFHDRLFENQRRLGMAALTGHAEALGLDMAAFNSCVEGGTHADRVQRGIEQGQSVGVSGTPTFFINGKRLVGAQPVQAFQRIIDSELEN